MQANKNITSQTKQSFTKREKKPSFFFKILKIKLYIYILPFFSPHKNLFILKKTRELQAPLEKEKKRKHDSCGSMGNFFIKNKIGSS
jgi:hypothetical protein